ncbi:GH10387 [Drosophila grimshawi]|uniref:GH10387 n=1 Tax=Drosophila grimshawi TaxID=7222 RepID=B4JED1_DROGR|nr:GH10387 [Drosophila grimshawi]
MASLTSDYRNEDVVEIDQWSTASAKSESHNRTAILILDYKQFIAARCIQALWRGYQTRKKGANLLRAAITIQRWWRGFRVRNNFIDRIEEQLTQAVSDHYNQSATKIQAVYRGWNVRQTVHDVYNLQRMQRCAAEELLSCCAYRLHHLLRTYSIPGVYSLHNSHCLSKVEKLLSSISFRFHNIRVLLNSARMLSLVKAQRDKFKNSIHHTEVPFSGPNYNSLCNPPCEDTMYSKDMDRRMYQIIAEYEKTQLDPRLHQAQKSMANRKFRKHVGNILAQRNKMQRDFCGDVIHSMRKWKIWDDRNLTISRDILVNPGNINSFLADVSDIMQEHDVRTCHCKISIFDTLQCF